MQGFGHRFWISVPAILLSGALALAAPPAYAGKLDSIEKAAKTYIAKKETSSSSHGLTGSIGHGKASGILSKGKKLLGK